MALTKASYSMIDGATYNVKDFGAVGDGVADDTTAFSLALQAASSGGAIYLPKGTYVVDGGFEVSYSKTIKIFGDGAGLDQSGTSTGVSVIKHVGDNLCFKFTPSSLWAKVQIEDLSVFGNNGASANFVEFSDSWNNIVQNVMTSGYALGAVVRLVNRTTWTENFNLINTMFRGCLYGVKFERVSATGGTNSFYGTYAKNACFSPTGGGTGFHARSTVGNEIKIYASQLDYLCEFPQGGISGILIGEYCRLVDSVITVHNDAIPFPSATDSFAIRQVQTDPALVGGYIDAVGTTVCQQGTFYNVSSLASGSSIVVHNALLKPAYNAINNTTTGLGPSARLKGLKYKFGDPNQTTNKTFYIDKLQFYTSYKINLYAHGVNLTNNATYIVSVYDNNTLPSVDLVSGYDDANAFMQVIGGAAGHSFSAGNGLICELQINAATLGNSIDWMCEVEML